MGLNTTYDCYNGPYSYFDRWRERLALVAGWQKLYTDEGLYGRWHQTPKDPLDVLFMHSDCEGIIQHEQCDALADALDELLDRLEDDDDILTTQQFIKGLREAAADEQDVEFF